MWRIRIDSARDKDLEGIKIMSSRSVLHYLTHTKWKLIVIREHLIGGDEKLGINAVRLKSRRQVGA